jgi:hypothetical protein
MHTNIGTMPLSFSHDIDTAKAANVICVTFIWLLNTLGKSPSEVSKVIQFVPGVRSAELSKSKAKVFIVKYDRTATSAGTILQTIKRNGYQARLVGC